MATVVTQSMTTTGAALTYSSASVGGDRFTPGPRTFMHVVNDNVGALNVTLVTPGDLDGLAIDDRVIAVPTGANRLFKLPVPLYRSEDGLGDVTWDVTASVTFAVVEA